MKKLLFLAAVLPFLVSVPSLLAETEYVALPPSVLKEAQKKGGFDVDEDIISDAIGQAGADLLNAWQRKNLERSFVSVEPIVSCYASICSSELAGFLVTYTVRDKDDARPAFCKATYVTLLSSRDGPTSFASTKKTRSSERIGAVAAEKLNQWQKGNASGPIVSLSSHMRFQHDTARSEIAGFWIISKALEAPESHIASK